jgi:hypothetical protein
LKKTDRFSFGFISLKSKKPNRTQIEKKPSQTRKNRVKQKKTEANRKTEQNRKKNRAKPEKPSQIGLNRFFPYTNRTEISRFEPVSFFFKENRFWLFFFIKTKIKIITPNF